MSDVENEAKVTVYAVVTTVLVVAAIGVAVYFTGIYGLTVLLAYTMYQVARAKWDSRVLKIAALVPGTLALGLCLAGSVWQGFNCHTDPGAIRCDLGFEVSGR